MFSCVFGGHGGFSDRYILARSKLKSGGIWYVSGCLKVMPEVENLRRAVRKKELHMKCGIGLKGGGRQVHVKGGEQPSYDTFAKTLPQLL